jgi:protein gp37
VTTAISWTSETWNPVVGCEPVSAGCDNCYAKALHDMRHDAHLRGKAMLPQYHVPFEKVQLMAERIPQPLHWRKPRRVFVNSVSDLFHKHVNEDFLDRVFAVMALTPQHTYQILTKRPARMRSYVNGAGRRGAIAAAAHIHGYGVMRADGDWPLPNVWLGVSVENQLAALRRIPMLAETTAAVRFLSCEPLLGPIDFDDAGSRGAEMGDPIAFSALRGCDGVEPRIPGIDWVIVGGESGPKRRPMNLAWLRDIVTQCRRAGVAVWVKQDSAPKSEDWGRIPDELRIREFPATEARV